MGQHRDDTIHQIHTGAPVQCLLVQRTAFCHIMGHICNVYSQSIPVSFFCQGNGIIQILGILSVNGHRLPVTTVHSACHILAVYFLSNVRNLLHHLCRKLHRNFIGTDNGQNICPRIVHMSDDFRHLAFRIFVILPVTGEFHYYFMPVDCSHRLGKGHKNIPVHLLIVRHHKTKIPAALKRAHNLMNATLHNLHHMTFRRTSGLLSGNDNLHHIFVHGTACVVCGNKHILLHSLYPHKTKTLRISFKYADQRIGICLAVLSLGRQADLPLFQQFIQNLFQFLPAFLWHIQKHAQFLDAHRLINRIGKQLQNQFFPLVCCIFLHLLLLIPSFIPISSVISNQIPSHSVFSCDKIFLLPNQKLLLHEKKHPLLLPGVLFTFIH